MRQKKSPDQEHNTLSCFYHELKDSYYALKYVSEQGFVEKRTEKLFRGVTKLFKQFEKLPKKVKDFAVEDD